MYIKCCNCEKLDSCEILSNKLDENQRKAIADNNINRVQQEYHQALYEYHDCTEYVYRGALKWK